MKSLFTSALIALTLTATSASFANENSKSGEKASTFKSVVYPVINSSKIRVNVNKEKGARILVTLKNEAGETLATEHLRKADESSAIRFDLGQLEDGNYQVEVSDGWNKQVKEVKLHTTAPTVATERHIAMK
ncbi:hypothetical protein [Larkinella rosea]|uniref:T9SS C-terminal target domain-containing protein n=1 Tax=Larkinella rosea TaxID=2025312 RepID=A0A3P1C0E1_9BACT|nr:hypothetical protein [Larkinella rosea]RRB06669.1 hypothetical protein EHT25_02420 [Larkinella rosea]